MRCPAPQPKGIENESHPFSFPSENPRNTVLDQPPNSSPNPFVRVAIAHSIVPCSVANSHLPSQEEHRSNGRNARCSFRTPLSRKQSPSDAARRASIPTVAVTMKSDMTRRTKRLATAARKMGGHVIMFSPFPEAINPTFFPPKFLIRTSIWSILRDVSETFPVGFRHRKI